MAEIKRRRFPKFQSLRSIKYLLDLKFIPAWHEELPSGYECNQKTWDGLDSIIPNRWVFHDLEPPSDIKPFINIVEGLEDGFHPVYIAVTPPKQRKKRRK
jgi:hypothetical protein